MEDTQTQTEAQTDIKSYPVLTRESEAMHGRKESMHTNTLIRLKPPKSHTHIAHTHTHTFSFLLSLTHTQLDLILNTNTVVQMTQAYFINQKNPQEKYLDCRLLALPWACVVRANCVWRQKETQTCWNNSYRADRKCIKSIFCPWTLCHVICSAWEH